MRRPLRIKVCSEAKLILGEGCDQGRGEVSKPKCRDPQSLGKESDIKIPKAQHPGSRIVQVQNPSRL